MDGKAIPRIITEASRNQFDSTFYMLQTLAEVCQDEISRELSVSREDIKEYLNRLHNKTTRIFDKLNDEIMAEPIMEGQVNFTYTDVILTQIRHIMYNIGYLNGILRSRGSEESDWYAYNET